MSSIVILTDRQTFALQILSAISRGAIVQFIYEDQDGVISIRHARPSSIRPCVAKKTRGILFMEAFDVQRNAFRRFRLENILKVEGISACTGEITANGVIHDGATCPLHEA